MKNKASPVFFLSVLLIMFAVSAYAAAPHGELQAPLSVETAMMAVEVSTPVADAPVVVLNLCNFAAALEHKDAGGGISGNTIKNGGATVNSESNNFQLSYSGEVGLHDCASVLSPIYGMKHQDSQANHIDYERVMSYMAGGTGRESPYLADSGNAHQRGHHVMIVSS